GQLTLSFSKAVSNPILHIAGLGGTVGDLGITTELELVSKDVTLSKLSGNSNLDVKGNQIINTAPTPDASSRTGAASGSIQATGNEITTLVFNVYLKGDGAAPGWEKVNQYNGDRWLISASLNSANVSGGNAMALPIYITKFNVVHESSCSATL